jgi:hypothetical protein
MAKAKQRARLGRTVKSERAVGKVAYRVLDSTGTELDVRGSHTFALFRAQRIAELSDAPRELVICSQAVFGPPSLLTRIVRDKCGVVLTHIISEED